MNTDARPTQRRMRRGLGRSAFLVFPLGFLCIPVARADAPASQAAQAHAAEQLTRPEQLSGRLDRYRVNGDVRTHLFFRYSDAPYTRATVACLLAAEQASGERGTAALLRWADAALARVASGSPLDELYVRPGAASAGRRSSVTVGWMAGSSPAGRDRDNPGAEVDLVACLGADLFVDARPDVTDAAAEALAERATFLGVAYRRGGRAPAADDGTVIAMPTSGDEPEAVGQWRAALWLRALTGSRAMVFSLDGARARPWLLEATAHCSLNFDRLADALGRFPAPTDVAVLGPPASGSQRDVATGRVREALAEVQVAADVLNPDAPGDEDLARRYKVLILAEVDSVSAAARERIRRFRDAGNVLLGVGKCLSDVARTGPGAISFDLEVSPDALQRLCDYVVRLRDRGTVLADQVVPAAPDGAPIRGLRSGTARSGQGQYLVYVVNLANTPSSLTLRSRAGAWTGRAQELIADRPVDLTRSSVVLPPHAIWILRMPAPSR